MKHFNIEIRENDFLTRENYIENISFETELEKDFYLKLFDRHMSFFSELSQIEFQNQVKNILYSFDEFIEVKDLTECNFPGIYIMILDKYKQIYVGVTSNIKKRIKQHWNKIVKKDYLYNEFHNMPMGIDSFKALDTTRIFVQNYEKEIKSTNNMLSQLILNYNDRKRCDYWQLEEQEAKMIKFIDNKFLCNKYVRTHIKGGKNFIIHNI